MLENSLLVPKRAIYNAIGAICKKPSLLTMDGINLVINDFEEDFYKIVFGAVNNIIIDKPTISKVTEVDVDNYLADNSKAYKIYEDNNGFSFISSAIKNANVELFEQNYAWIKKYSLLRDFNTYGINIKAPLIEGKIKANDKFFKAPSYTLNDGTIVNSEWNLFAKIPFGLNVGYN